MPVLRAAGEERAKLEFAVGPLLVNVDAGEIALAARGHVEPNAIVRRLAKHAAELRSDHIGDALFPRNRLRGVELAGRGGVQAQGCGGAWSSACCCGPVAPL